MSTILRRCAFVALPVLLTVSLQGCDVNITGHATAAWASKPSYLTSYMFVPPGAPISAGVLNTCELSSLSTKLQCNANGLCRAWNSTSLEGLAFCECYRDWADPECRTKRQSQTTCYLLSLFFGVFGADRFYLGEYTAAFGKLSTLGGLGIWWVIDVVRVGSAPVYADNFRLAADLPHAIFVIFTILFFVFLGYLVFGVWATSVRRKKQRSKMLLQAEDKFFTDRSASVEINASDQVGMPSRSSWGIPTPVGVPNYGAMDPRMLAAAQSNPYSSYHAAQVKAKEMEQAALWSSVNDFRSGAYPADSTDMML